MSETRFLWTLTALPAAPGFAATEEALASSLALLKELCPRRGMSWSASASRASSAASCSRAPRAAPFALPLSIALRPLVPLIRRYHAHADADVRWRCALALDHLHAYDPEDRSAVRVLALDLHSHVRGAAVRAMRAWITQDGGLIEAEDRAVLARVCERFPIGDSADCVARELLA